MMTGRADSWLVCGGGEPSVRGGEVVLSGANVAIHRFYEIRRWNSRPLSTRWYAGRQTLPEWGPRRPSCWSGCLGHKGKNETVGQVKVGGRFGGRLDAVCDGYSDLETVFVNTFEET